MGKVGKWVHTGRRASKTMTAVCDRLNISLITLVFHINNRQHHQPLPDARYIWIMFSLFSVLMAWQIDTRHQFVACQTFLHPITGCRHAFNWELQSCSVRFSPTSATIIQHRFLSQLSSALHYPPTSITYNIYCPLTSTTYNI